MHPVYVAYACVRELEGKRCTFFELCIVFRIFDGRPADYLFMLTFNWVCCVIVSLFMGIPFLMDPMVLATLYVWCQLNKDVIVNFWFGTQFKVSTE